MMSPIDRFTEFMQSPKTCFAGLMAFIAHGLLAPAVGAIIFLVAVTLGWAQQPSINCGPAAQIEKTLLEQYGETVKWAGKVILSGGKPHPGIAFVVAQSPQGTWTLYSRTENDACIMAMGSDGKN